jgi:hypothetical protein
MLVNGQAGVLASAGSVGPVGKWPASAAAACVIATFSGCGDGGNDPASPSQSRPPPTRQQLDTRQSRSTAPQRARCPVAATNCRAASGRIVYIEAVDPDGDGDAHFVLLSPQSITGPGISVIDVKRGLRPHPLPRVGEQISAAGPVYTGSYGQRQIEATELHVAGH